MASEKNSFLKDNYYLLIGVAVLNVSGFLFHFIMGRKLGPENYGVLATLVALTALLGIFSTTIQFTISKFVASFKTKKMFKELRYLYISSNKKINNFFFVIFLLFLVVNIFLAKFLHISYWLLSIISLAILTIPSLSVYRGFLQGLQKFRQYGDTLSIEGSIKLVLAIIFVSVGWKVYGAIFAVILGYAAALFYGWYKLKEYRIGEERAFASKPLYDYTLPMFFTVLFFTAFYSIDLLLVKHFFPAIDAGNYAVISLLGKVVFFASFSVVQVMFPKVVELSESNSAHKNLMWKSWAMVVLITIPILIVYYFFNEVVVNLLFGSAYLGVAAMIFPYGIFMTTVSLSKLMSLYLLSLKKFKFLYVFLLFFLAQVVGIYFFHESLLQVIVVLETVGVVLLLLMLVLTIGVKDNV